MPSPYRTSPRQNRTKRDTRYPERSSSQRNYGGQSRKKIHRDYQNNGPRQHQRQKRSYQDRHESRPTIRVARKQQIEVKINQPPSQIKVHFRFRPLKINPKNQQQLMKELKNHISSNVGPVQYFQKSYDSHPGYLIIQLGFKYDHDANLYYTGKKGQFEVTLNKQVLNISAQPTKAFTLLIEQNDTKKKKVRKQSRSKSVQSRQARKVKSKRKSNSSSRSKSSSSSSRSNNTYERQNRPFRRNPTNNQHDRKWTQNQRQRRQKQVKRQPYNRYQRRNQSNSNGNTQNKPSHNQYQKQSVQDNKTYKKLYFFGVHYSVNSKDMIQLLYNHKQGPFYSQQFLWRRMNGSISQYLQGKFQQQQAQKLLQLGDKMQVKGHPFIIIESQSIQNEKLLEKISQFQVNIEFPKLIQPYYLLKSLKQCGRVIQIISINRLNEQGRSDYYNVTFNSRDVCQKLKALKKTQKGILIENGGQEDAIFIYRPNSQTQLLTVNYIQDQNQGKRGESSDRHKQRQRDFRRENN